MPGARRRTARTARPSPSRRTSTCADTRRPGDGREIRMRVGRQLVREQRSIHGPPNSPGGRLMPCTTISSGARPGGRSSQLGDSTWRAPRSRPSPRRRAGSSRCRSACRRAPAHARCPALATARCAESGRGRVRIAARPPPTASPDDPRSPTSPAATSPHVWHPCTQMKDHECAAADPDRARRGRLAARTSTAGATSTPSAPGG